MSLVLVTYTPDTKWGCLVTKIAERIITPPTDGIWTNLNMPRFTEAALRVPSILGLVTSNTGYILVYASCTFWITSTTNKRFWLILKVSILANTSRVKVEKYEEGSEKIYFFYFKNEFSSKNYLYYFFFQLKFSILYMKTAVIFQFLYRKMRIGF